MADVLISGLVIFADLKRECETRLLFTAAQFLSVSQNRLHFSHCLCYTEMYGGDIYGYYGKRDQIYPG